MSPRCIAAEDTTAVLLSVMYVLLARVMIVATTESTKPAAPLVGTAAARRDRVF